MSQRRVRLQVVLALIYGGIGALIFVARGDLSQYFGLDPRVVFLASLVGVGTGAFLILMLYLRGDVAIGALDSITLVRPGRESGFEGAFPSTTLAELQDRLSSLTRRLEEVATTQAGGVAGDRTALVKSLTESITSDVAAELARRFAADAAAASHIGLTRDAFTASHSRLRQQIESLNRRANLNLIIGVLTTLLAVGLLAYMVLTVSATFTDMTTLMSHYVPRITTVIFIEVFSFFFLRLYKSSLAEVQYYQNELTTLASQQIALESAHARSDSQSIALVVQQLAGRHHEPSLVSTGGGGDSQVKPLTDLLQQIAKLVAEISKGK